MQQVLGFSARFTPAAGDRGCRAGLVNTSQQIGGAIGLAIFSTVATTRTSTMLDCGASSADALTSGFSWVFLGAAFAALAVVCCCCGHELPAPGKRTSPGAA